MAEENLKFIQMKNGEGVSVFPITKVKAVEGLGATLEDLQSQINNAVAAGVTDVKVNGTSVVENNVANVVVPTTEEIQGMIDTTVGQQIHMNVEVVEALPETGVKGIIYLVAAEGKLSGSFVEYIWTGEAFEQIGTTETGLTNYATKKDLEDAIKDVTDAASELEGRVATLEGEMDDVEGRLDVVEPKVEQNSKDIAANAKAIADNKDAADAAIKAINESAVMTSGITADLVAKIGANEAKFADYYTKGEADAKFETIDNVNLVKEDVAQNAEDIKAINESAVMTSGITADLVAKIGANEANFSNYFTKAELANVLYYEEVELD